MTQRPQNECEACGYTWYPRGKNLSARCPNCGSSRTTFVPVVPDSASSALGVLLGCLAVPFFLFLVCAGLFALGLAGRKPNEEKLPPTDPLAAATGTRPHGADKAEGPDFLPGPSQKERENLPEPADVPKAPPGPDSQPKPDLPAPTREPAPILTYKPFDAFRGAHPPDHPIRVEGVAWVKPSKRGFAVSFEHKGSRIVFGFVPTDKAGPLAGKAKEDSNWQVTIEGHPHSESGLLTLRNAEVVKATLVLRIAPCSQLFKGMRRYAEKVADAWYVLSAEHGVLRPEEVIAPYERTLNKMRKPDREAWAKRVQRRLLEVLPEGAEVIILAGMRYREGIVPFLEERGFDVTVPMKGMQFGPQLRWLKEQV
jgi:hypothetical protein